MGLNGDVARQRRIRSCSHHAVPPVVIVPCWRAEVRVHAVRIREDGRIYAVVKGIKLLEVELEGVGRAHPCGRRCRLEKILPHVGPAHAVEVLVALAISAPFAHLHVRGHAPLVRPDHLVERVQEECEEACAAVLGHHAKKRRARRRPCKQRVGVARPHLPRATHRAAAQLEPAPANPPSLPSPADERAPLRAPARPPPTATCFTPCYCRSTETAASARSGGV
eukprot:scaffold219734_cov32-Tisochrysis_lutea.AAC.4